MTMNPARLALVALLATLACAPAAGAGFSLRFGGTGAGDVDRVKMPVDDPGTALPGPPLDVGAADFTIELWIRGTLADNTAGAIACGANGNWIHGNVVVDRDRFDQDRKFGVSLGNGRVAFGVSGQGSGEHTLCGGTNVLDNQWHHVAVQRRRGDGRLWIFVDGSLDAEADGPDGDVSYPDDGVPGNHCGGPCTGSDPYLVIGAEKHDAGPGFPSFRGYLDELRISSALRYATSFPRPRAPFLPDAQTVGLFHFDEGQGSIAYDSAAGGWPTHGLIRRGSAGAPPWWSTDTPFANGGIGAGTIRLTPVATGLSSPVDIAFAPDDPTRMFVVEQGGRIRVVRDGLVSPVPFLDAGGKTLHEGERGMLAMAFDPGYAQNRRFFVFYTRTGDGAIVVERYEREPDAVERADPDSGRTLLTIPHPGASNHNGGKLAFGPDGYLYISTGDGGGSNDPFQNGQNFGTRLGKLLRVDASVGTAPWYAIPATNPFAAQTCNGAGQGTCPEIWALGLRNPWRISFDKLNGDLWIGDVGQGDREEIDYLPRGSPAGANFGWRILEGGICTPAFGSPCAPPANYVPPVFDYPRSLGVSVTGGFRYRGRAIPALSAAYLYGDFGSRRIWAATSDSAGSWTGNQQLLTAAQGVSSFGEGHDGELYVAGYGGTIYRIDPADQDGDGLPDWWEQTYFGSAAGAAAGVDSDGDGSSNLAEYLGGTDPLNPQSKPAGNPGEPPRITSSASVVCVVAIPCSHTVTAVGSPAPALSRSGTFPAGIGYSNGSRTISGTPQAAAVGTYVQTFTASNGFGPDAVQQLRIVVVAGCGGLSDVTGADLHCNSVEWLRNRSITQGCTSTQYCPLDDVIRASMALFMHRMGTALTPAIGFVEAAGGPVDAAAGATICTMEDVAPVGFPRSVEIRYAVSLQHAEAATVGTTLLASRNGGATWEPVSATRIRTQTAGPAWRSAQGVSATIIEAGESVRFALRLDRESASGSVIATRCQIATLAASRDGAAPPRDSAELVP